MEKPPYKCPLCCSKTFSSKQLLLDHLNGTSESIYCPICNALSSSLIQLVDHLTLDNCQSGNIETIVFEVPKASPLLGNSTVQNNDVKIYQNDLETNNDNTNFTTYTSDSEVNTMYADILNKQLSQQSIPSQELELVKENGDGHYMIVTQDSTDGTIVTKQNNDGTISLTSVKDMKMEAVETESPNETEDSQEEIYSCNTCKVSFSSVIEHIQNFHNDQDVVVEQEPIKDDSELPVEFERVDSENVMVTPDKQTARRVITDTGNIVEEPVLSKTDSPEQKKPEEPQGQTKKVTRVYTKPKALKTNEKIIPYHKVMAKKVPKDDGFTIIYECLMCKLKCSNNLEEFKAHACRVSKYCCTQCPSSYDNPKSLCAHMKVHKERQVNTSEVVLTYECEVCCTIFPTNKSLKLHKRMHDPIKSRPIDPPVENTDGTIVSEKRYLCGVCNKMIPIDYRTIHQASHKATDKINCNICNKKFTSHEYLEMHINVHNVDKVTVTKPDASLPYNCLYCNRRFARPHEKVKHERIHTGEKPHSCEICGKSFRVSYCLTLHMRTHTGARPYVCKICGKRFKAHSGYNHHLLTHSDVRAYKCPFCPKAFKTAVQLAGHKNSHTKPFSCQQCNRPFASLYAVRVHTETHARQNNLKFSCRLCGASYARAFAVKDHVKQAHKDELDKLDPAELENEWGAEPLEEIQVLNEDLQEEVQIEPDSMISDLKIDTTEHELIIS